MFDHRPSPDEVSKWFSGFKLHEGLTHEQYVGGIVVIENTAWVEPPDGGRKVKQFTWVPYVNATARIAYFWDWCDKNGYLASVSVSDPTIVEVELPEGKKGRQLVIHAEVTVEKETEGRDAATFLRTVRFAEGRKQVSPVKVRKGYNGSPDTIVPDPDALMKAETGAIARALGTLGMLALPGSGLATAEDMADFIRESAAQQQEPVHSDQGKPKPKAAPNPK